MACSKCGKYNETDLRGIPEQDICDCPKATHKPYNKMTDDELRQSLSEWESRVEKAGGWSSAYFAANEIARIVIIGEHRGLILENKHPIKFGY